MWIGTIFDSHSISEEKYFELNIDLCSTEYVRRMVFVKISDIRISQGDALHSRQLFDGGMRVFVRKSSDKMSFVLGNRIEWPMEIPSFPTTLNPEPLKLKTSFIS